VVSYRLSVRFLDNPLLGHGFILANDFAAQAVFEFSHLGTSLQRIKRDAFEFHTVSDFKPK